MNIAFLSSLNPKDIHHWSGTLYYMFHELGKLGKRNHVEWIDDNLFSKCITRDLMATTLCFMLKNMQKRMVIAPKSFYNWRSKFGLAVCPTINDPRPPQDRSFIPIRCQATGMAGGRTYAHSALSPCCR